MLASYGQVLMSKRFLTRDDSEQLLGLYSELADAGAMASWMAAEFRAAAPENPDAFQNVMAKYVRNTTQEEQNLPLKIPAGAVIDLGKVQLADRDRKPIWFPPNDEDVACLPSNKGWGIEAINDDVVCGNDGADLLIGGRGNDRLRGQGGSDMLRGGPGRNVLKGGTGRNKLSR